MFLVPTVQIAIGGIAISATMVFLWFVQRKTGNAGIVDAGWAAGIGLLGIFFAVTSGGYVPRRLLIAVLIGVWSLRLAAYLFFGRVLGHPEEGRYQALRKKWAPAVQWNLFRFYQIQASTVLFFALPVLVIASHPANRWTAWDLFGTIVWCVGVGNTILSDHQLARFKRRPESRGKTCQKGWWRYSRHPNYFFEWLHWCAYPILAVGAPFWWLTPLAPALMLYFLLRVTGIPLTEAQAVSSRGEEYRQYQRTTSVFVPWFPRHAEKSNPS
jgi:steroid 5-alpha reductase family enzyme